VAPFIHFGAIMPRYIFFRASGGQAIQGKSFAALLPPTAFTFGTTQISSSHPLNVQISLGVVFVCAKTMFL
jgi:hypothetical protein